MTRARLLAVLPDALPITSLAAYGRKYPGARIKQWWGGWWITTDGDDCDCTQCFAQTAAEYRELTGDMLMPHFTMCPDCGNKRCPKNANHDNACTGSNEPGQPGSDYA